jgi:nucleoside-diphosphate-sugar epimerase
MGQKLAVVVTGGTGKQGGAVVKSLLERGHEVRAVTRSTDSAKARELANAASRWSARHSKTRPRSRRRSKERPPSSQ